MTDDAKTPLTSDPERLVWFLNIDLRAAAKEARPRDAFSWWDKRLGPYLRVMLLQPSGRAKLTTIQRRFRRYVLSLIKANKVGDVYQLLGKLIKTLNNMGGTHRWQVEPVDYEELYHGGRDFTYVKRDPSEIAEAEKNPPGRISRLVEALGYRWFVVLRYAPPRSLEQGLYVYLLATLVREKFSLLKVCDQCAKFFIQADPRQKFCTDGCRFDFHNKERLKLVKEAKALEVLANKKLKESLVKMDRVIKNLRRAGLPKR